MIEIKKFLISMGFTVEECRTILNTPISAFANKTAIDFLNDKPDAFRMAYIKGTFKRIYE